MNRSSVQLVLLVKSGLTSGDFHSINRLSHFYCKPLTVVDLAVSQNYDSLLLKVDKRKEGWVAFLLWKKKAVVKCEWFLSGKLWQQHYRSALCSELEASVTQKYDCLLQLNGRYFTEVASQRASNLESKSIEWDIVLFVSIFFFSYLRCLITPVFLRVHWLICYGVKNCL